MPLLDTYLNAAFLFLLLHLAILLDGRALNPAPAVRNVYLSPSQPNLTSPVSNQSPDQSTYQPICLNSRAGLNLKKVAEDCSTVLNDVLLRLDGPFEKRAFVGRSYIDSNHHWIPAQWVIGQCTINVGSPQIGSVDMFTLFEVALTANKILLDCVTSQNEGQGGLMQIGSREKSYHVGLQGFPPGSNVDFADDIDLLALPRFEVSKQALDAKRTILNSTGLRPRAWDSREAVVSLSQALSPSNSTRDFSARRDHDIDCFPRGSRLPDANVDDCNFIINHIILGMKDPLREQSWGFTDFVDINLSLREYKWNFKDCFIRVKNIDETQVDRFRPVDVAEVAQNILQKCVVETKERLGGNADIGHLQIPRSFYVVLSGLNRMRGGRSENDTTRFLPLGGSRTIERRTSLTSPEENSLPIILPGEDLTASKLFPVVCFNPTKKYSLKPAIVSDCKFIINDIILRLPNPMKEQTFGFTDAVDINISKAPYNNWTFGQCIVFIRNIDHDTTRRDRFRFVDIAYTAHRITEDCVQEAKYALGGIADVGTIEDSFYVGVSGIDLDDPGNGAALELVSDPGVPSPSNAIPGSTSRNRTESKTYDSGPEYAALDKRSSNINKLVQTSNGFAPSVRCIRSGMPAARPIDLQDCSNAATVLLSDPKILIPQSFTTELTGGIKLPLVQHDGSCYLMMDTTSTLSVTDSIPLLKMVYWALEIMLKCIVGREQPFGGISVLDQDKRIIVSVTGVNPTTVGSGVASLSRREHFFHPF